MDANMIQNCDTFINKLSQLHVTPAKKDVILTPAKDGKLEINHGLNSDDDTYFDTNSCVERLLKEWDKYGKLIVAYDFDDTVNGDAMGRNCICEKVIELLNKCKEAGCTLIVYTARPYEECDEVKKYLKDKGIPWDYFNENDPTLNFNPGGKVFYNIFFEDRAGLGQTYDIMRKVLEIHSERDK